MPQEDYLKRQMDQFAKALAKLLLKLRGLKNTGTTYNSESVQIVNEVLEREAQITIEGLLNIPANNFVPMVLQTNKLNNEQLELLGDVLSAISEGHPMEKELLRRTHAILEYIHSNSGTYSLERQFRIEQIRKKIDKIH